ncbi:MAG TPA: hypothetical protein VMP01_17470 [Pirellulaceae bacterium]|nr:hypothetical protein [Pirellulaceae bacterium]
MIDDQEIALNGHTYRWQYNADEPSPQLSWRWVDVKSDLEPGTAVHSELNSLFLTDRAPAFVSRLDSGEIARFRTILRSMGASGPKVNRILGQAVSDRQSPEHAANERARSRSGSEAASPFTDGALRDWAFSGRSLPPWFPKIVSLFGSGPFCRDDFGAFLQRFAIAVRPADSQTTVVIIGRTHWTESEVDRLIDEYEDGPLRIYSQEMFLGHMLGNDPFEAGEAVLDAFKRGHPALEFVAEGWSGWVRPWIAARAGRGARDDIEQVEISPLKKLGYAVGASGLSVDQRSSILRRAFKEDLPFVDSAAYMEKWGEPDSSTRLRRIAEHLARNCRSASARGMWTAFADWFYDLAWLKAEFYHGHHQFDWPDDCVRQSHSAAL